MDAQVEIATSPVLAKGKFAELIGVTPARVSQYISEGKIYGDALDGEGRDAKIRVAIAQEQLKQKLDIGQRLGNGIGTRLDNATLPLGESSSSANQAPAATPSAPAPDPIEARLKEIKLEQAERANREAAMKEEADAGRYVLADDMRRELGRALTQQMAIFDGMLVEFANAVASKFEKPQRDVLHTLRGVFREARARAATQAQAKADAMPQMIDVSVAETDDDAPVEPTEDEIAA